MGDRDEGDPMQDVTDEKGPHAGGITNVPKTYRDVYWCGLINEPMIIKYKGEEPQCSACDNEISFEEDPLRYTDDHKVHAFMFHVLKPARGEAVPESPKGI